MSRPARITLVVVLVVLLLPIVLVGGVLLFAKTETGERWLEARASAALGRAVAIDGISLMPGWPPRIFFDHLRISNPEWAETRDLIDAQGLYARVAIPPLFAGKVVIPWLGATRATAGLEIDGKRATWRFSKASEDQEESNLVLLRVNLGDGRIRFIDKPRATDLDIAVKGGLGEGAALEGTAEGRFRGQPTQARARIPNLSPQHEAPIQVSGEARMGRTKATAEGQFATDASTLDLRLTLAGATLKDLSKVSGIVLPDSPPYTTHGRLRREGADWIYDPFQGKVGDSDIRGRVLYRKGKQRPFLQASLTSKLLDFDDLGPLIGAPPKTGAGETAAPEQKAQTRQRAAEGRLLPEKPFGTEAWGRMDADVTLVADRVQRPKQIPIESLRAHLLLEDSVVTLKPLNFGFAGGRITSDVVLDPREKPMRGDITADIQGLDLGKLFPTSKAMRQALGTLYGRTRLAGRGYSVADLLGTSAGQASLAVDGGRVNALLVELLELDVAGSVMLLGKKFKDEELRCAVGTFVVKDGRAEAETFTVDTAETEIKVHGAVDLAKEALDIEAAPYAKHTSLVSLRTPILIEGPFRKPRIHPKVGPLAARGAAALALGAAAPPLALLALFQSGTGKDTNCAQMLSEARKKGAVKTEK